MSLIRGGPIRASPRNIRPEPVSTARKRSFFAVSPFRLAAPDTVPLLGSPGPKALPKELKQEPAAETGRVPRKTCFFLLFCYYY